MMLGPKPKPEENYTLDRIDNNKGYQSGNLRWATHSNQANNRSDKGGRYSPKTIYSFIYKERDDDFVKEFGVTRSYANRIIKKFKTKNLTQGE